MSKTRRHIDSGRRQGALVALLAAASLLGGALALAPAPALAMTDENNECANIPDAWQQYQCEQDHAGSGGSSSDSGTASGDTDSQPDESAGNVNDAGSPDEGGVYPPAPTHTPSPILERAFDDDSEVDTLHQGFNRCRRILKKARQATGRHPHHVLAWLLEDPNDSWIQDDLAERWHEYECSEIFEMLGRT